MERCHTGAFRESDSASLGATARTPRPGSRRPAGAKVGFSDARAPSTEGTVAPAAALSGRPARAMGLRLLIIAALGVALALYVVRHIGFHAVLATAASVGWHGLALLCALAVVVFGILGAAWYVLIPPAARLPLWAFECARMVRDSASEALPFSQVGGMMLGVRTATVLGVPPHLAIGSMIPAITAELLAQLLYVATGLLILNSRADTNAAHALVHIFLIGLGVAALAGTLFLGLQHRGLSWASDKLAVRMFPVSAAHTATVAGVLREIYARPLRVLVSVSLHFCGWIGGGVGTWIAFRLIGLHVDIAPVLAIDSLVYAARSAAFFVPNAIGVQEAAYAALGPLVGIGKEFALAVSLLKRARDVAVGVPILLLWQLYEARCALARRSAGVERTERLNLPGDSAARLAQGTPLGVQIASISQPYNSGASSNPSVHAPELTR